MTSNKKNPETRLISPQTQIAAVLFAAVLFAAWILIPKDFPVWSENTLPFFIAAAAAALSTAFRLPFSEKTEKFLTAAALFVVPALWLVMTESVSANDVTAMQPLMLLLGYACYLFVAALVLLITGRIRWTIILGTVGFMTHAVMNVFVIDSRGYGIRTTDLAAARTAMNVASEYQLVFHVRQAQTLLLAFVLVCFGIHLRHHILWKTRAAVLLFAGVLGGCLGVLFINDDLMRRYSIKPYMLDPAASCRDHGAMLEFAAGIPYLQVKIPEGYSAQTADRLEAEGASKKAFVYDKTVSAEQPVKPDLLVIMNESFSDLRNCGPFEISQENLSYFYTLKDNVIRGTLSVPVQGGYTANTEFEFLTGFSNAMLPTGSIAFQNYVEENTPCIRDLLGENGYYSVFMHPYLKSGWNREEVYRHFGFDEVVWEESYEGKRRIRGYMSDSGDYQVLIEKYEEAVQGDRPVFLFNVTMQNHGGYRAEDYEPDVRLLNMNGEYPEAEQYLSLIKESDSALEELIGYFEKSDRPVLILFFGDHTPAVEDAFYEEIAGRAGFSTFEKGVRIHQTPFVIYANYDIEEKVYENVSVNYLSSLLLDAAGVEKNDWFAYQAEVFQEYPVLNLFGVKDAAGQWYDWETASSFPAIKEYSQVQYRELFDRETTE